MKIERGVSAEGLFPSEAMAVKAKRFSCRTRKGSVPVAPGVGEFAFTEWFGWVFSGLVVPGYMAAVAVVRPLSIVLVLVEAIVTWALVRGLGWLLSRTGVGTPPFGRDRFIWIVVLSTVAYSACSSRSKKRRSRPTHTR